MNPDDPIHELINLERKKYMSGWVKLVAVAVIFYVIGAMYPSFFNTAKGAIGQ